MKTTKFLFLTLYVGLLLVSCTKDNGLDNDCDGLDNDCDGIVSYNTMTEFFSENGVQSQTFTINVEDGSVITGEKGTVITIPENAFEDNGGNAITGSVTVSVKEIFTASEMVLSNRPTNAINGASENTFLLSEGETEIRAEQDGTSLKLVPGKSIQIKVPSSGGEDAGMGVFLGTVNSNDNIVWNQFLNTEIRFQSAPDSYIYDVFDMGWTNCDKFYGYPGAKTTNYVNLSTSPNKDEARVFLIFKENNLPAVVSFTQSYIDGLQSYVNSLPVGLQVTYVGITIKDNQQFLATKTVTISNDEVIELSFSPASTNTIKETLEALN